jgi:hypothetical protein
MERLESKIKSCKEQGVHFVVLNIGQSSIDGVAPNVFLVHSSYDDDSFEKALDQFMEKFSKKTYLKYI